MKSKSFFILIGMLFLAAASSEAAIVARDVEYKEGAAVLEGYVAYDDASQGRRPGVLVVHEWTGLGRYAKKRAEQLAGLGYVAFAADIYGQGIRPDNPKDAGAQASIYKNDRNLMRRRVLAGLEELKKQPLVDASRLAAIGYCFGGTAVLELARTGADLRGVVSFHGGLDMPNPEDTKKIKAKVLILHGADDPYAPVSQLSAFEEQLKAARVDWQVHLYGGAVHSFTNPDSGNDPLKGAAYNESADRRSWEAMKAFFKEIFS